MNLQKKSSQESDIKFPNPPADSISSISCNGSVTQSTNMVIATAWDNTVNCYEIQSNQGNISNIILQGQTKHDAPVLCSDISSDNVTAFSGACDGTIRMWNVTQGPTASQVIGKHDLSVKSIRYIPENNVLVSASWDKTLRVWDMRQPTPAANIAVSERIYAMDAKQQAVVLATADKQVHVFDITAGRKISEFKSPLTYQTRCLSLFHDNKGFAMGCIEGRIALEYFDELGNKSSSGAPAANKATSKNFAYKCHRDGNDIFSINAIHFHPKNTFVSAGSDGVLSMWDKDARHRLAHLEQFKRQCPITDVKFNQMGNLMFYSMSYDWSRGAENNDAKYGNNIFVHAVQAVEITPKAPTKK